MKHSKYSVVIVGSGISGLYAAIKLSESMNLPDGILLLTKSQLSESNSRYAQGGIVGVLPENAPDSVSLHVADTIKAGCGLSDFNVVKFISENSQYAIKDLMSYGVEFDRDKQNGLTFTLEGAHSVRRILHVGGDATGYGIEKALVNKVKNDKTIAENISIYEQCHAVELLIDAKGECRGIISFNEATKEFETIYAGATVLATGGVGQVYKYTTNPTVATGDGLALAVRAKAEIKDMEFIQFHPTALSLDNDESRFLISESVRGEGAKLVNSKGEYFMERYHEQKDLAPRDIVSRSIVKELEKTGEDRVFLDASLIPIDTFTTRFPNIYKKCLENGVDVTKDYIPVSPAAHYCMGGIKTSVDGTTSIRHLYAIGEAGCTSLHGANRLASNSLLECVVTAFELVNTLSFENLQVSDVIDDSILSTIKNYAPQDEPEDADCDVNALINRLKDTMWKNVGIIRDENSLLQALSDLKKISEEFGRNRFCTSAEEFELRNLLHVALVITNMALKRKESIGAHFRSDSPVVPEKISVEVKNNESSVSVK
ncbi:TPA: L-aspartate oxidase [Candidatus Spyradomonas excrementavium]|nr:L-aspartate oxidase [Candidatus Spyradomonas excrementavium]